MKRRLWAGVRGNNRTGDISMLNFTVGPVQESEEVLEIGARQTPYFRNASFSQIMKENEQMIKKLALAPEEAKAVFLTSSGTGAMEAAVMNSFTDKDKVLVVNGGSFGQRFAEICSIHRIAYEEVQVGFDEALTEEMLQPYENQGFTGLLINMHETSIGKLYDMQLVADFCKRNHLYLLVDAISSFLADPLDMEKWGIDVLIASSQKALAVPPGISVLILSERAVHRIHENPVRSMYFDLTDALKNAERGQTPFTPAVSILLQIHARLASLVQRGVEAENRRTAELAEDFRSRIKELPFKIASPSLSNAVTPLLTEGISAHQIFEILEQKYGIWICPNGGELRDKLFRVGHIGNLTIKDNEVLVSALRNVIKS